MTTHAPERSRPPISSLRLLRDGTTSQSSARLDLDGLSLINEGLSSLRTGLSARTVAPAPRQLLPSRAKVVTECASLMNGPG